ncbi:MAG: Arm DNA-binding domain-containing protein [Cloacibacillus porcorum]|uniref:Arm DNA-binding domain-containing protein n=1 Tax=Cloacibacillus porcorum TaxID=1197717 RepID=UPI0023F03C01|nr:Arm DNA-binding domain-containing protein [Cloacibacillus porcorum]MCD7875504.1 Arm DNA-binding domain-containing protein [Cloacibacillus porcorum]
MKTKLSANVINSCICPPEKRFVYIQDTLVPGLFVCVTRAGEKNFVLRFTPPGGKQRICKSFASCESITLTAARNQAKSLKAQFTVGKDPFQEAKAEKEEYQKNGLKLSELFSLWKNDSEKEKKTGKASKIVFPLWAILKKKENPRYR